ncbi:MAG TPA: hypothetical protein VGF95_09200 [Solirubrobacteraceae bacterium]|jgi:hypothetical protein
MSRVSMRTPALTTAVLLSILAACAIAASAPLATAAGPSASVAKAKKHKAKQHKPKAKQPKGPSMKVLGFGVNRLFVPAGKTVSSNAACGEMVGSDDGSPIGPPQNVYLTVYLRASDIPAGAQTKFKDELPEGDEEIEFTEFSPPTSLSNLFSKGAFIGGTPQGVKTQELFHTILVSGSDEEGEYEGPSAEEFDGNYGITVVVEVGSKTLTSTAKVEVDCPMLR